MIFCAGLGTRFKPWTDSHPKALAIVNGKSLLQRNIEYLQRFGITDVIVNVHHFGDQIVKAIKQNKGWGSNILISDESDTVLETGGGLLKAKELFHPGEEFMTLNVDILTDLDLDEFIGFHLAMGPLVSLAVSNRKSSRCFTFTEDGRLGGWRNQATGEEKIRLDGHLEPFAFSGISIFNYDFFNQLHLTGKFSLVDAYLGLAAQHTILGYKHNTDKWVDVGRPESVAVAEELFK
jgi:N-acetyl-alpha-D-muramate 1-phosphate uridylyltransferase